MQYLRLKARALSLTLDALLTCRISNMRPGDVRDCFVLDVQGDVVDTVALECVARRVDTTTGADEDEFVLACHDAARTAGYLEAAARAETSLIAGDSLARLDMPIAVEPADEHPGLAAPERSLEAMDALKHVDVTKPFFVGQDILYRRFPPRPLAMWEPPRAGTRPHPRTLLGDEHDQTGVASWGSFGSATMPIQYEDGAASIPAEHLATRMGAGLFDVSHMLPIIVRGRDARALLDICLVHKSADLEIRRGRYEGLAMPDGTPLDDVYLYYLDHDSGSGEDVYLIVGNSGHEADYYFLRDVAEGKAEIDHEMPGKRFEGDVRFVTRLEETHETGRWGRPLYSLALQGPRSRRILLNAVRPEDRDAILALRFNDLTIVVRLASTGAELVVSYTGYTGEPVGYEVYAAAEDLIGIWRALREGGARPCGLGARDSLRQEAGFPLFGHEIDGPLAIPFSGGRFRRLVSFEKPFFVGRAGALALERQRTHRVFLLYGKGPRKVSGGWPVFNARGARLGTVTSTSTVRPGKSDATQGYLVEPAVRLGDSVFVTPPGRRVEAGQTPAGREFVVSKWEKCREYACEPK